MMPPAALPADFVDQAAALVCRRAGLYFDQKRRPLLEAGLGNALRRIAASVTPSEYLQRLDREPELFDDLLAELTVGETYFFRDRDQFSLLRERVVPELISRRPQKLPLRIWSAGCASGEEPYSVAILLHQLGALAGARIVGTDISRPLLRRARRARYTSWSLRGVPDEIVRRYFTPAGDGVALAPTIRETVELRYLNLAAPSYQSLAAGVWGMDLILCRNVLIYFAPSLIAEVGARLAATLADDGWLLLGSADPLLTELAGLSAEVTPAGVAYRRTPRAGRSFFATATPGVVENPTPNALPAMSGSGSGPVPSRRPAAPDDTEWQPSSPETRGEPVAEPIAEPATLPILEPGQAGALVAQVRSLVNAGRLAEAETVCRGARTRHALSAELAVAHAFILLELGSCDDARTVARRALYLDPADPLAHLALGTALIRLRDGAGARRAFQNAERLLAGCSDDVPVAGSEGEPASRLAELARTQIALLDGAVDGTRE